MVTYCGGLVKPRLLLSWPGKVVLVVSLVCHLVGQYTLITSCSSVRRDSLGPPEKIRDQAPVCTQRHAKFLSTSPSFWSSRSLSKYGAHSFVFARSDNNLVWVSLSFSLFRPRRRHAQATSTGNIMTSCGSSNTADSLQKPTTSSWATTSTAASSLSRPSASLSTRSNSREFFHPQGYNVQV